MKNHFRSGSRNIIETILVLLLLLALLIALYQVLRIFFGVLTFALIFSVSFSQLFERIASGMQGRRKLTATIYTIVLIAIIALPFTYIIGAMSTHIKEIVQWMGMIKANGIPPLPAWIINLPFVGNDIAVFWRHLQESPRDTIIVHEQKVRLILHHIITSGAGIIGVGIQLIIGIIISAFLLVNGNKAVKPLQMALQHLLGRKEGLELLNATTQAVKGVAIGVMGTAFIAAVFAWIGLKIAAIPFALGLAALVFFLVIIQIGPLVVWIPLVIYMFMQGQTGMTVFLIIYGVLMVGAEAVLKPLLIAKSGKLPFLVIFLGVIGGLAAWGFTGIFKGAIIVAVFYTIFNSWLDKKDITLPVD